MKRAPHGTTINHVRIQIWVYRWWEARAAFNQMPRRLRLLHLPITSQGRGAGGGCHASNWGRRARRRCGASRGARPARRRTARRGRPAAPRPASCSRPCCSRAPVRHYDRPPCVTHTRIDNWKEKKPRRDEGRGRGGNWEDDGRPARRGDGGVGGRGAEPRGREEGEHGALRWTVVGASPWRGFRLWKKNSIRRGGVRLCDTSDLSH